MYRRIRTVHGAGLALLLLTLAAGAGCGDVVGGGTDGSGSLLRVELINPTYNEENTDQVDLIQSNCETDPTLPADPEFFSDHFAEVTLTNRPLPNFEVQTANTIYLTSYQIRYTAASSGTPPLVSRNRIPLTETQGIAPCEPGGDCSGVTYTVELVPIALKADLAAEFLQLNQQFTYNAHYTFFGYNDMGKDVSADGSTMFYAANYDYCN